MAELGIAYEGIHLDEASREHESASYRARNPMAQIPLLVLPDGSNMTESGAISLYLAETKPESGLAPAAGEQDSKSVDNVCEAGQKWRLYQRRILLRQPPFADRKKIQKLLQECLDFGFR